MTNHQLAIQAGHSTYEGRPCKNCQTTTKRTSNRNCLECNKKGSRASYEKYREDRLAKWKQDNLDNPGAHYRKHMALYKERAVRRKKDLDRRSFPHERKAIVAFRKACPDGHEVDHIIPLNHPLVCGLHCVANLQYLTVEANREKSNKWKPE